MNIFNTYNSDSVIIYFGKNINFLESFLGDISLLKEKITDGIINIEKLILELSESLGLCYKNGLIYIRKYEKYQNSLNDSCITIFDFILNINFDYINDVYKLEWNSSFLNEINFKKIYFELQNEIFQEMLALKNFDYLSKPIFIDVILDSKLSSQFIHECIGHTSEADNYLDYYNNYFKLGYQWSSVPIDVIDNPTFCGCKAFYLEDDEDSKAFKTYLVRKGIWEGLLHTSETSKYFNETKSCNARKVHSSSKILPRMSVTYLKAGEYQLNELIKKVNYGIYCKGTSGGKSFNQCFTIKPNYGQVIKNGSLIHEYIFDFELIGNKFDAISKIRNISENFQMHNPAYGCDKKGEKQLSVSLGAPEIFLKKMILRPLKKEVLIK